MAFVDQILVFLWVSAFCVQFLTVVTFQREEGHNYCLHNSLQEIIFTPIIDLMIFC
jgi:hypothetical protein